MGKPQMTSLFSLLYWSLLAVAQPHAMIDGNAPNAERVRDRIFTLEAVLMFDRRHWMGLWPRSRAESRVSINPGSLWSFFCPKRRGHWGLVSSIGATWSQVRHPSGLFNSWDWLHKGVATQCLREKKLEKANNQYWNNIALKFVSALIMKSLSNHNRIGSMLVSETAICMQAPLPLWWMSARNWVHIWLWVCPWMFV